MATYTLMDFFCHYKMTENTYDSIDQALHAAYEYSLKERASVMVVKDGKTIAQVRGEA